MNEHTAHATPAGSSATGTLVLLVRHGATSTTGTLLPGRAAGLHLADSGHEQAQQVAVRLLERHVSAPLDALLSSPLERALETATPTAERTGLAVQRDELLLECDVGEWTGRTLADLARLPEWRTVQSSPSQFTFPGGESFTAMQERMVTLVERLRTEHPGGTVACFSHADPIRSLLAHALGSGLDSMQRLSISPASVSAIHYPSVGDPVVLLMNSSTRSLADLTAH
ncbi:histidine phosphatase family protein [Brachybacterium sp. FME24]|uniref:histidine phosphatase family protein n=1 Tax=Brachybacterium sp. FME24 TaxID=2742605 RepID=UPI00186738DE|nr:histidine phosphatase family protein [Brachybacterium sp. FME24]